MSADHFADLKRWYDTAGGASKLSSASLLRWYHTVGYARHNGVSVDMRDPPAIAGDDIEYLDGQACRIDGRDMTPDEIALAKRLLIQMCEDARDALQGTSTLVVVTG